MLYRIDFIKRTAPEDGNGKETPDMDAYEHQAQYYETDQMGIIHHSNYIRWMESARIWWMQQLGLNYREMEEMGVISSVLEIS